MSDHHGQTYKDTFDVYPKDLSTRPCIEQVIQSCTDDWDKYKADPEQSVPIHSLVVFHSLAQSRLILHIAKETTILESEQVEAGEHHPNNYSFLSGWESLLIVCVKFIMSFVNPDLIEFIKNTVQDIVCYQC